MKVFYVITNHSSKGRPTGRKHLENLISSLEKNVDDTADNFVYIIDNQSDEKLMDGIFVDKKNIRYKYFYIEDQSIGGLTWAWNFGIKESINDGADIIINLNDDLVLDKSINNFVKIIYEHPNKDFSLFGPTTNSGGAPDIQVRNCKSNEIVDTDGVSYGDAERKKKFKGHPINGFAMGFTKEFYHRFNLNGWLFSEDIRDAWGCQEDEFYLRNIPLGLKNYIVGGCFIKHIKERSWRGAREFYNHPKRTKLDWGEGEICKAKCY